MGRRYRTKSEASAGDVLAITCGFVVFFPTWLILGAALFPAIGIFGFFVSFIPLLWLFNFAQKAGTGALRGNGNSMGAPRRNNELAKKSNFNNSGSMARRSLFQQRVKTNRLPKTKEEERLQDLYEKSESLVIKYTNNISNDPGAGEKLAEAESLLWKIYEKLGYHPYTSIDKEIDAIRGRGNFNEELQGQHEIKVGERGGLYTDAWTKDGRPYRRYF